MWTQISFVRFAGGANPKSIKIDIAHTYAIAGYGKDDLASCLVFLAVRCEIWGPGRYEDQLERAWVSFKAWCVANKKIYDHPGIQQKRTENNLAARSMS